VKLPENVQNLPPAVKMGATLAAGGGIMAALAVMFPPTVLAIIALGVALVGVLFVVYKMLLKWLEKRKAAPMERAIAGNSAAAPTSINNPARRARLDDMRRSFEGGVEKFREAGKNLYSLPWYVLVGEPGSGKTEAIRHCNVGFPPGLQDQLQGVGGTINMNWWFTNYAVILDTAGRLMFEEVEPGTTSEWQEFLKLLRKGRPNCPVNGLLLVIPAESLIRDTADAIERKAGKIAQQLDAIQRTLGVRFPVYVVVTKCDLINGFREFFDDLADPQLQHQMLGWSNPADLDDPFNPELVEQHLRTVQQRLVRRRLSLLQDPIHTEDASKKRTEQVDALYAFPDAMIKIAPRLRRYLEMIFVAGEWSSKPLFLRGIYFTSSMREGSALDADLAEALGMPVEALPEGRVWERERAYFLRDLFMNKVFREKGLVTRASNTSAQMRKRRTLVYGTAGVGALAVALLTFLGWRSLSKAVDTPSRFWAQTKNVYLGKGEAKNWVSGERAYYFPLAQPQANGVAVFDYRGVAPSASKELEAIPVLEASRATVGDFPVELMEQARRSIGIPWVYKPVAAVTGFNATNLAAVERAAAAAALVDRSVIEPLADYARAKLEKDLADEGGATAWPVGATGALRELIGIKAASVAPGVRPEPVRLEGLAGYVLRQEKFEQSSAAAEAAANAGFKLDYDAYKEAQAQAARQLKSVQEAVDWLYSPKGGAQEWPSPGVRAGDVKLLSRAFARYRANMGADESGAAGFGQVKLLIASLQELRDAERALHEVHTQADVAKAWVERYARVRAAAAKAEGLLAVLGTRGLRQAFEDEFVVFQKAAEKSHDALLERFTPVIAVDGAPDDKLARAQKDKVEELQGLHDEIRRSRAEASSRTPAIDKLASEAAELDPLMLKVAGRTDHAFRQRLAMYEAADHVREPGEGEQVVELGALQPRLGTVERAVADATGKIEPFRAAATSGLPEAKAADDLAKSAAGTSAKYASDVAGGQRRAALLGRWVDELMPEGRSLDARAAALSASKKWEMRRPEVPMTRAAMERKAVFDPAFDARAASAILGDAAQVDAAAKASAAQLPRELAERTDRLRKEAERYSERYLAYWSRDLAADLAVPEMAWADFAGAIKAQSSDGFNTPLAETSDIVAAALRDVTGLVKVEGFDPADLRRQAEAAKSSLNNNQSIRSGRVFAAWRGLGDDSVTASSALRLALKDLPAFQEQYITCYAGRASGQALGNFVERFWEDFCYTGLKSIADRAKADGNAAFGRVRSGLKFPVILAGADGEMSAAAIGELRRDVEQAALIGGKTAESAPARGLITCDRFNGLVGQLQGAGALQASEQQWLDRVREVVGGLPDAAPIKCKVFTTTDRQLQPGEPMVDSIFPNMAIVSGAGAPGTGVRIRNANAPLGEFNLPDPAPLTFHFFAADGLRPEAGFAMEGSWGIVRLLERFNAERSATDAKVWYLKLPVSFSGQRYFTWLKLEMEKELPELKKWRELRPTP
jgi:hypothetical protein